MMHFLCSITNKYNHTYLANIKYLEFAILIKEILYMAENNKNLDTLLSKVMEDTGMSIAEEMLMLQRQRQIKTEHKPVSKMTDSEKEIFAEMQREYIEICELPFLSDKPINYTDGYDPYFSPVASTVLDAFFTDSEK